MLNSEYKIKKSQYLPKLSLSAKASYSNQDEKFNSMINDTNKDDATSSGSLILSMSKRIMNEVMCLAEDNKLNIYY